MTDVVSRTISRATELVDARWTARVRPAQVFQASIRSAGSGPLSVRNDGSLACLWTARNSCAWAVSPIAITVSLSLAVDPLGAARPLRCAETDLQSTNLHSSARPQGTPDRVCISIPTLRMRDGAQQ